MDTAMTEAGTPAAVPAIADRAAWQAQIDQLRDREKAHTRAGDAIAAARRRLPMVEVDPATQLVGATGPIPLIDTFQGRTQLFASYHMWHTGRPAADQCEGCTFFTGQVRELSYLHARDVTFAGFARDRTTRARATGTSWGGPCRGTRCRTSRATSFSPAAILG